MKFSVILFLTVCSISKSFVTQSSRNHYRLHTSMAKKNIKPSDLDAEYLDKVNRLGYYYDENLNEWKRGPTSTALDHITVKIDDRMLVIEKPTTDQCAAANSLQWVLTKTNSVPDILLDIIFRNIVKLPGFIVLWFGFQFKLYNYLTFSIPSDEIAIPHNVYDVFGPIISVVPLFIILHMLASNSYKMFYDYPLQYGKLERALADQVCGLIYIPSDRQTRAQKYEWKIIYNSFLFLSSLPRVALVHGKVQPYVQDSLTKLLPFEAYLNDYSQLYISLTPYISIFIISVLAFLYEFYTVNLDRKSGYGYEEKAILEALDSKTQTNDFEKISDIWRKHFLIDTRPNKLIIIFSNVKKTALLSYLFYISGNSLIVLYMMHFLTGLVDVFYMPIYNEKKNMILNSSSI